MSKTLQQLEMMRSILDDFMDNTEIQASIRGSAFGFSLEVKKAIRQYKCQHLKIETSTHRLHNNSFTLTVCCHCDKLLKQEVA